MIVFAVILFFLGSTLQSASVVPANSSQSSSGPCPPCHCLRGYSSTNPEWIKLDCDQLPGPLQIHSWNLTGYAYLSLDGSLPGTLAAFPTLPGITTLSLRFNALRKIASSAFVGLVDLKSLDLSNNRLTADVLRADVLRGPWRVDSYEPLGVEELNLRDNDLHSLGRRALEHLPELGELHLDGNPLGVIDRSTQDAIASATKLKVLSLSGCSLRVLPAELVPAPPHGPALRVLDLSWNYLEAVPGGLPASLERLSIDGNPIRDLKPTEGSFAPPFLHLSGLRELSLSYLPLLEAIPPAAFFGLSGLQALSCTNNPRLREVDHSAFSHMGPSWTLTEVSFRNNSLNWIPAGLLAWRGLTFLDLTDNPWHCSCNFTRWSTNVLLTTNIAKGNYRCATPRRLAGHSLWSAWNSSELCPEDRPGGPLVAGSLLAAVTLLLLLAVTLVLVECLRNVRSAKPKQISQFHQRHPYKDVQYAPAPVVSDIPDVVSTRTVALPALPAMANSSLFWTKAMESTSR